MKPWANDNGVLTYGNYVQGEDVGSDKWVHVLSVRAMLEDSFQSLRLKRDLDRGTRDLATVEPGMVVGRVAVADEDVNRRALEAAAAAAIEWRAFPIEARLDILDRVHAAVRQQRDELIRMLTLEGHPLELAKWEYSGMLEATGPAARDFLREQLWREYRTEDGRRRIVRRQPDGVVCVNPPANAPMSSALLAALSMASGNAVVVRAPRTAPMGVMYAMRELIAPLLDDAGVPPGTLNVVCGHPAPLLKMWLESPHVDDIMYFGNVESGLKFEQKCVAARKKPILELAGNDSVLVWADADLDHAADAIVEGFFGSGQLCMIPNQVLAHPAIADELIERMATKARAMRPGYPDTEGVVLSPVLRHDGFHAFLDDAVTKGATLVTGGRGMHLDGTPGDTGFFLEPTVIRVDGLAKARELDAVREETFFPLIPVVVADKGIENAKLLDGFIQYINTNTYGLRNSLWAKDDAVIDRYVTEVVNGGLLKINESHIAFAAPLPSHGGTGVTGGVFGEANYPVLRTTHLQGVAISDGNRPPRYR
ncbi:aldehyde dehydrogenase family protein [Nocardia sp. NPDC052566]|uniref:aldehyde dehydrogenase family protein n=1 Tax=Nocardia sp. NPDC052566 TaxID=3364330 RepID=UPI0037C654BC